MSILFAQYDLMRPGQDYDKVHHYFDENYSSWCRPLESAWLFRTDKTSRQVLAELSRVTDSNDKVVIFDVTHADGSTLGLTPASLDWMQAELGFNPFGID